jgi:myosin heavy subunit
MNTENQSDLGTESNNPTTNESKTSAFDQSNLADLVSKSFLGGEEVVENSDSEKHTDTEGQATSDEDNEVLSQEANTESEQEQSEDSEETEETKSDDDELERGLPKGVKKRIDKLSAKRREAEAEVERLKSEVERLSQEANKPAQTPKFDNPYSNLNTLEEVSREAEQAKQIRRWCELNPDGAVVSDANGNETEYTAEEIRKIKIKTLDALEEHLPARARYLENYFQVEQVAHKEYPWWKDRSSSERQIADTFLKHFPEIARFPDYKMVLGDYIRGVKSREAASKRPSGMSNRTAPVQPKRTASPPYVPEKDARARDAARRYSANGNRDDLSSIIANRFL